jgi:hypothetical protein
MEATVKPRDASSSLHLFSTSNSIAVELETSVDYNIANTNFCPYYHEKYNFSCNSANDLKKMMELELIDSPSQLAMPLSSWILHPLHFQHSTELKSP